MDPLIIIIFVCAFVAAIAAGPIGFFGVSVLSLLGYYMAGPVDGAILAISSMGGIWASVGFTIWSTKRAQARAQAQQNKKFTDKYADKLKK